MDSLLRRTDADLVMNTMFIQKPHNVAEVCQVSREAPEPHAVNCALEDLDANGLGRVLSLTPRHPLTQIGSDEGERMMAEKSPKCLHQSSGAGENDVRKIGGSVKTDDPVLPEEFGCRANSRGTVPPVWLLDV